MFNMQGSLTPCQPEQPVPGGMSTAEAGSATMAAFVFAVAFRGSGKLFGLYLATMMIPGTVTMVPNYIILRVLGLLDTYTGLVLPSWLMPLGIPDAAKHAGGE